MTAYVLLLHCPPHVPITTSPRSRPARRSVPPSAPLEPLFDELVKLRGEGKIKYLGLGGATPQDVQRANAGMLQF